MVFDKQHLSLFLALASLAVYANAVPTSAISKPENVNRLRGDLHQFIELILSCITRSNDNHSNHQQLSQSLQEDVPENDNMSSRKFDNIPIENTSGISGENAPESTEDLGKEGEIENTSVRPNDDGENRVEFEVHGDTHGFTPRPSTTAEVTESVVFSVSTTLTNPPGSPEDIGLRRLADGGTDDDNSSSSLESEETHRTTSLPREGDHGVSNDEQFQRMKDKIKKELELLLSLETSHPDIADEVIKPKVKSGTGRTQKDSASPESLRVIRISNKLVDEMHTLQKIELTDPEFYEKLSGSITRWHSILKEVDENPEDLQVRNSVQGIRRSEEDSINPVHPYTALHIYGIRDDGRINKIVFEGGDPHPPRPLTANESQLIKEFIRMILETNSKDQVPIASFPKDEQIASRAGFNDKYSYIKSPWANKPVPLELV